tara:strand:- start:3088 stop:3246 length:159 start_codon:yes stop_codon:yes gene_type:complete
MTKNIYLTISVLLVALALIGGRYIGLGFIERLLLAFIVGGLFEILYRKVLKK